MATFWPFFVGGFVAWSFFAAAISLSVPSLVANASFITRIYAPKAVFPVSAFLVAAIEGFAFALVALILLPLITHQLSSAVLFLPVAAALFLPFVLGACLLMSTATVFFRDVAFIWTALNALLFFCTPILYPISALPATVRPVFEANPLYPFVRMFQDPLLGTLPPADLIATAALYSVIMLALGTSVFSRSEKSFYLYL